MLQERSPTKQASYKAHLPDVLVLWERPPKNIASGRMSAKNLHKVVIKSVTKVEAELGSCKSWFSVADHSEQLTGSWQNPMPMASACMTCCCSTRSMAACSHSVGICCCCSMYVTLTRASRLQAWWVWRHGCSSRVFSRRAVPSRQQSPHRPQVLHPQPPTEQQVVHQGPHPSSCACIAVLFSILPPHPDVVGIR